MELEVLLIHPTNTSRFQIYVGAERNPCQRVAYNVSAHSEIYPSSTTIRRLPAITCAGITALLCVSVPILTRRNGPPFGGCTCTRRFAWKFGGTSMVVR